MIGQFPNAPLIIALVADVGSFIFHGQTQTLFSQIADLFFAVWAGMEIGWGVNPFRRILGSVVLVLVVSAFIRSLN